MNRLINKIDIDKTSLFLIVLTNCFLCFFEEVLKFHFAVLLLYAVALGLMLFKKKITVKQNSAILLLYVLGIFISFLINGATFRTLYRAALSLLIVSYAAISDADVDVLELLKRALVIIGLFNAAMVLLQFVLRDNFNDFLYSLFDASGKKEALFYYKRGYYAGVNIKPHETAGMISVAIAVLFTTKREGKRKWWQLLPIGLFLPLLLTGKRAILALTAGCVILLYLFIQVANRQWHRVAIIGASAAIAGVVAVLVIKSNLDKPLFARFASLFDGGSFIDDTRLSLWNDALLLFKENPLFGVGWGKFNDLTVERFNYYRNHSVNLDYLQWLCETGIVGFSLMITPIISTAKKVIKLGCRAAQGILPSKERDLIFFALYIQSFILLYALIEVPFYNNLFFAFYVFSFIVIHVFYTKHLAQADQAKTLEIDLVQLVKNFPRTREQWKECGAKTVHGAKRLSIQLYKRGKEWTCSSLVRIKTIFRKS